MATQNYFKAKNGLEAPSQSTIAVTDSNFPTVRPTLNLDFAGSKSVDSRITFTRASAATYFGADGKLKYAAQNEPRIDYDPVTGECKGLLIEEQRSNLYQYSDAIASSQWVGANGYNGNIVKHPYTAYTAPDGTYTAVLIKEVYNSTAAQHIFDKGTNQASISGTTYTYSVYLKKTANSPDWIQFYFSPSGFTTTNFINLNLTTLSFGNYDSFTGWSITPANNGWYRVAITCTAITTSSFGLDVGILFIDNANVSAKAPLVTGNGNKELLVWGPQIEAGSFATSYLPSYTTFTSRASSATYFDSTGTIRIAGKDQARNSYQPQYQQIHFGLNSSGALMVDYNVAGVITGNTAAPLYEDASTNLVTYSQNITTNTHGYYLSAGGSLGTTFETTAPDGSYSASKMVFAGSTDRIDDGIGSYIDSTWYTYSVWLKGPVGKIVCISLLTSTGGVIEPSVVLTGQWQRVSVRKYYAAALNEGNNVRLHVIVRGAPGTATTATTGESGVWTDYVYVWGMQVETTYVPTSYIPTFGAQATRAADVISSAATTRSSDSAAMYGTNFSSWFNTSEGTVLMHTSLTNDLISRSDRFLTFASARDESSKMQFDTETGGRLNFAAVANSQVQAYTYIENRPLVEYKLAAAYNTNDFAFTYNSTTPLTDTSGTVPNVTRLHIGSTSYSTETINGFVKKLVFYPKRLSNAQLQALTA